MRKKRGELKIHANGIVEVLSGDGDTVVEDIGSAVEKLENGELRLKGYVTFQDLLSGDEEKKSRFREFAKLYSKLTKLGYVIS